MLEDVLLLHCEGQFSLGNFDPLKSTHLEKFFMPQQEPDLHDCSLLEEHFPLSRIQPARFYIKNKKKEMNRGS